MSLLSTSRSLRARFTPKAVGRKILYKDMTPGYTLSARVSPSYQPLAMPSPRSFIRPRPRWFFSLPEVIYCASRARSVHGRFHAVVSWTAELKRTYPCRLSQQCRTPPRDFTADFAPGRRTGYLIAVIEDSCEVHSAT